MSDSNKTTSEIIVLETIPSHQSLMKTNRWLVKVVLFLMTIIFIGSFLLLPNNNALERYSKVSVIETNQGLSTEVNILKGQLVGLISGSIESKLRALEESIRSGTLNHSLGTIQDLKNDVEVLKSYSSEPVKKDSVEINANDQYLLQEMSYLKRLIYLSFASCGLMLAAIGGIWIKHRHKLLYKEIITRYLNRN